MHPVQLMFPCFPPSSAPHCAGDRCAHNGHLPWVASDSIVAARPSWRCYKALVACAHHNDPQTTPGCDAERFFFKPWQSCHEVSIQQKVDASNAWCTWDESDNEVLYSSPASDFPAKGRKPDLPNAITLRQGACRHLLQSWSVLRTLRYSWRFSRRHHPPAWKKDIKLDSQQTLSASQTY